MRCKIHGNLFSCRIAELLLNLRCMSVCCHTVCFHALVHFAEQVRCLCPTSRSGSTGFCINNQCIRINQSLFYQRICCQNGTGRITSRICNQTGLGGHLITVNLTESVNGFLNKLWAFMLNLIPFFIGSNIFDSKIRTQINDLYLI